MENSGLSYTILAFFTALSGAKAYAVILLVLLICGFGVPIPEDITLLAAGVLAGTGKISTIGAYTVGFIGVLAGDTILFLMGKKFGRKVFEWPVFRKIFTPALVAKAEIKIQANAKKICFIARFLPGLRAPIFLMAGVLKVPTSTFLIQDGFAALISVPVWIYLGHWAGGNMEKALQKAEEFHILLIFAILAFFGIWLLKAWLNKRKLKNIQTTKI